LITVEIIEAKPWTLLGRYTWNILPASTAKPFFWRCK